MVQKWLLALLFLISLTSCVAPIQEATIPEKPTVPKEAPILKPEAEEVKKHYFNERDPIIGLNFHKFIKRDYVKVCHKRDGEAFQYLCEVKYDNYNVIGLHLNLDHDENIYVSESTFVIGNSHLSAIYYGAEFLRCATSLPEENLILIESSKEGDGKLHIAEKYDYRHRIYGENIVWKIDDKHSRLLFTYKLTFEDGSERYSTSTYEAKNEVIDSLLEIHRSIIKELSVDKSL